MLSQQEYDCLLLESKKADKVELRVVKALFDGIKRQLVLNFTNGSSLAIPVDRIQGLADAADDDIAQVEILGNGADLNWEPLDVQFEAAALARGIYGNPSWMRALRKRVAKIKKVPRKVTPRSNRGVESPLAAPTN